MINKICVIDVENLVLRLNMLVPETSLTSSLELWLFLALYVCCVECRQLRDRRRS